MLISWALFGADSGFRVGWRKAGRGGGLVFGGLLVVLGNLSFWPGDRAPGYLCIGFGHFPDIWQFPRILTLKSFGNS